MAVASDELFLSAFLNFQTLQQIVKHMECKPVLIFGSGRGGTTWVQDVLAKANNMGTLFEPLHADAVKGAENLANLYIPAGHENAELADFMDSIFDGTIKSIWASVRVRPQRLFPPFRKLMTIDGARTSARGMVRASRMWAENRALQGRPKVIKFIRANLMIEWIRANYSHRAAIVVRHPCAVLSSVCQRSGAEEWAYPAIKQLLSRYLEQPKLIEDRLKDKMSELESYDSLAKVHAAIWCIENADIVSKASVGKTHVAFYEHLADHDAAAWRSLADALSLENAPQPELLVKPSQQASYVRRKGGLESQQQAGWQNKLTSEQIADVRTVINLFEVDAYSVDDPMPIGHAAEQRSHQTYVSGQSSEFE